LEIKLPSGPQAGAIIASDLSVCDLHGDWLPGAFLSDPTDLVAFDEGRRKQDSFLHHYIRKKHPDRKLPSKEARKSAPYSLSCAPWWRSQRYVKIFMERVGCNCSFSNQMTVCFLSGISRDYYY
jgi:hypothetical protein